MGSAQYHFGIYVAVIFSADIGRGVMDRPPESPTS